MRFVPRPSTTGLALSTLFSLILLPVLAAAQPVPVKIVPRDGGFQLLRAGKPYFIRGAGGSAQLDRLAAAGGNSIRTWGASAETLDQAAKRGLTVLIGLEVGKPRQGFDYGNAEAVRAQFERARETVSRLKDHPAVLMWALGNESELNASAEDRIRIWKAVEEMADMIKKIDPNHPVITVTAGLGRSNLTELKQYCPSLDAVGVNAYGSLPGIPAAIEKQGWDRPWLVTEFGPRGHWEVARTLWKLPIEDSSTEKADFYLSAYRKAIGGDPRCLGSYVFLWGQKQEKTHTWYGMFLPDGRPLSPVEAIMTAWNGKPPAQRWPRIGARKIEAVTEDGGSIGSGILRPGTRLRCTVDASHPDGGTLKIAWDLRVDVSDNPSTGGDFEPQTKPLEEASGPAVMLRLPEKPGNYRIFVYVSDSRDQTATANLPVRVE